MLNENGHIQCVKLLIMKFEYYEKLTNDQNTKTKNMIKIEELNVIVVASLVHIKFS